MSALIGLLPVPTPEHRLIFAISKNRSPAAHVEMAAPAAGWRGGIRGMGGDMRAGAPDDDLPPKA